MLFRSVAVDLAGFGHGAFVGREMGDDLVAVKIKVHPVRAGAAFLAAEQIEIEAARGGQVVGGEGEVEGLDGHGLQSIGYAYPHSIECCGGFVGAALAAISFLQRWDRGRGHSYSLADYII